MLGVVLEGGGARGAFHIGAVKALIESGYEISGVVGTSIGSFNAALICQGDFDKAYDMWINMDPSVLFDIDDLYMNKILNNEINKDTLMYLSNKTKDIIYNKGIDTSKLQSILSQTICEKKVRESSIDFGLVTVSLTDLKPVEVYKEDIPKGMIKDYIMASSSLPGFKLDSIDNKYYIDGGVYDNCPVNLLLKKGYKNIIIVRTTSSNMFFRMDKNDANITYINPSESLGRMLIFNNDLIRKNINMGYYDTLKVTKKLSGTHYYIEKVKDELIFDILNEIPKDTILKIGMVLKCPIMDEKRMLFEKIIPITAQLLKLPNEASYQDIFIGLLEVLAVQKNVEKYKVYTINELIEAIDKNEVNSNLEVRKNKNLLNLEKLTSQLLGANMLDELANVILDTIPLRRIRIDT